MYLLSGRHQSGSLRVVQLNGILSSVFGYRSHSRSRELCSMDSRTRWIDEIITCWHLHPTTAGNSSCYIYDLVRTYCVWTKSANPWRSGTRAKSESTSTVSLLERSRFIWIFHFWVHRGIDGSIFCWRFLALEIKSLHLSLIQFLDIGLNFGCWATFFAAGRRIESFNRTIALKTVISISSLKRQHHMSNNWQLFLTI